MKVPDFLIIGAQKGGTTSLFSYLRQHPGTALPERKEIHFFDKQYQKGAAWYYNHFPAENKITGEATPYYLYHPYAAERIANICPDLKLIVLLRNPIDRAYAHFYMEKNRNREPLPTFEEAIKAEPERLDKEKKKLERDPFYNSPAHQNHSYLDRGEYYSQLKKWLNHFLKERFLFLRSEEFFQHTEKVLESVFDFLGLPNQKINNLKPRRQNHYPSMHPETRSYLEKYFAAHNRKLADLIGEQFNWRVS